MEQLSLFGDRRIIKKLIGDRYFAVIEDGKNRCIWGIGRGRHSAIEDALRYLPGEDSLNIFDTEDLVDALNKGELYFVPCSRKLFHAVHKHGSIEFIERDGRAYLPEEVI